MKTSLEKWSDKIRKLRKNQPKATLKEAQEQAKRVMKAANETKGIKRLEPRVYHKTPYVLDADIRKLHGATWFKKFVKAAGPGNTMMIIPANDPSHKKSRQQIGMYMWDYERFADVVDFNRPTYFD